MDTQKVQGLSLKVFFAAAFELSYDSYQIISRSDAVLQQGPKLVSSSFFQAGLCCSVVPFPVIFKFLLFCKKSKNKSIHICESFF